MKEVTNVGIICTTYGDKIMMKWNNQSYRKTIPIIKKSCNTGIMWSNPSYDEYKQFESTLQQRCFSIIPDNANYKLKINDTNSDNDSCNDDDDHEATILENDKDYAYEIQHTSLKHENELLAYHERLGHIPFKYIQTASLDGLIPRRLAKCNIPICPSCIYGKLSRKPWKTSKIVKTISSTKVPGEFISVDQMESSIPGLIAQMEGIPTIKRYKVVTVFVDHATDLIFVYM
jgi:GAG-pre-integrase domain